MQRYFFSHLVDVQSIHIKLQELDLSEEEKSELLNLAHNTLQFAIIDTILSELTHEDKKIFLRQMNMNDHAHTWRFLNKKVSNIEDKVKKAAEEVTKQLHKDIKEAKSKPTSS